MVHFIREKFQNRYRIQSARRKGWDYAHPGYYFVTICTWERQLLFGDIVNDEMQLSSFGEIVRKYWLEIPKHFPDVSLDEFVVMPDHVHGIVMIKEQTSSGSGGLANIIGSYKSICTKDIHGMLNSNQPIWQPRFHDTILHTEQSLFHTREYIRNNPQNWRPHPKTIVSP